MKNWLFFFGLFLVFSSTKANEIRPCYLQIKTIDENYFDVTWKVPAKADGTKLAYSVIFDKDRKVVGTPYIAMVDGYYIENWRIANSDKPSNLSLTINGLSSNSSEVLLRLIDSNGNSHVHTVDAKNPHYTFSTSQKGFWQTLVTYVGLGVEHILNGFDHLLFVMCLVLISQTFKKLLWTITGFTLAHSITLILTTLNIMQLPIPPLEASIALSIVFLAVEIVKNKQSSLAYRYPVMISSGFGLLHGFGFASALKEMGLPQHELFTALLSFNLGVEIGQVAFILTLISLYWILSRFILLNKFQLKISAVLLVYGIGSVAMYWTIERISGF